ncbi:MAG: ATPase [Spirochaetia bacterium]|nr:ATPase [Spirochaetia bacterium]
MHQILILSGKGGTGKTTVASAFIHLSQAKAYADCDVDAPNLHLVMGSFETEQKQDYLGLKKAFIDPELCIGCDACRQVCRFDAIEAEPQYHVVNIACEGCRACAYACPQDAIGFVDSKVGDLRLLERGDEHFSTATLIMGSGTTGKLVTQVKTQLKQAADPNEVAILDGSPGIGCPVIASLSGVDLALMVAEPSVSGISDLKRVITSARQLQVPVAVIVNKYDMHEQKSAEIEVLCFKEGIPFLGKIPYDREAVRALNQGLTLDQITSSSADAVKAIYFATLRLVKETMKK